jgi:hypothetical protein
MLYHSFNLLFILSWSIVQCFLLKEQPAGYFMLVWLILASVYSFLCCIVNPLFRESIIDIFPQKLPGYVKITLTVLLAALAGAFTCGIVMLFQFFHSMYLILLKRSQAKIYYKINERFMEPI